MSLVLEFQIISHFLIFEVQTSFVDTSGGGGSVLGGGWSDLAMFSYVYRNFVKLHSHLSYYNNSQTLPNYTLTQLTRINAAPYTYPNLEL